ncbi:helix-turn-helix transcriptional regulator [Paenibacillus sp. P25]|nr:helix-turn-helix transcriptional regulator [Paenibacillus sp. P25]
MQFAHVQDRVPDFLIGGQESDFRRIGLELKACPDTCCMFTNEWGVSYLSRSLEWEREERKILAIGPFLIQTPDTRLKASFEPKKHIELEAFYRGLKLISQTKMQSIANLLEHAGSVRQAGIRFAAPSAHAEEALVKKNRQHIPDPSDEDTIRLINVRYQVEKEMMQAVESGDKTMFKKIHAQTGTLFDFSERSPNQPIRTMKNGLVILNTLFRISAERGKVQPFFLHQISEKFAKKIERSDTIQSLSELVHLMAEEYCDLVRNRAKYGYSLVVQKAAEYLTVYYSKPLNLQRLAGLCHVHPAHLSRQFRKETGRTLTEFQLQRRIAEAKVLLTSADASIGWIAGYVGFDDAAYFTRVFRRSEGMSPSRYRKQGAGLNGFQM